MDLPSASSRSRKPPVLFFPRILKTIAAPALAGVLLGLAPRSPAPPVPAEEPRNSPPESVLEPAKNPHPQQRRQQQNPRLAAVRAAGSPCAQAAAALELLDIDSLEEIQAIFGEAGSFPPNAACGSLLAALFTRWLELDPQGAADYCRRQHPDLQSQLIASWALDDAPAAMAWLKAQPDDPSHSIWDLRFHLAAEHDPATAWKMLEKAPGLSKDYDGSLDPLMKPLVQQDVEAAMARLDTMAPALQPMARRQIVRQLMTENPDRAWEWLAGQRGAPNPLEEPGEGSGATGKEAVLERIESMDDADGLVHTAKGAALAGWLHSDPEMAVLLMKNEHPVALWDMLKNDPSASLTAGEAAALAGFLRQNPLPDRNWNDVLTGTFFQNMAGNEEVITAQFFPLLSPEGQMKHISTDVTAWAGHDREAAGAWPETLPDGPVRTAGEAALTAFDAPPPAPPDVPQIPEKPDPSDPDTLRAERGWIHPDDPRLRQVTVSQLDQWAGSGKELNPSLIQGLARINPAVGASWLAGGLFTPEKKDAAEVFASQWSAESPAAAAAWVKTLSPGPLAEAAAEKVSAQYRIYSPEAAAAWLDSLPEGPVREAARWAP